MFFFLKMTPVKSVTKRQVFYFGAVDMGVCKNIGTPKSSILIGVSIIFTIHFGCPPLFLETSILKLPSPTKWWFLSTQVLISHLECQIWRWDAVGWPQKHHGEISEFFRDLCWLFCFCQGFFGNQPVPEGIDENVFFGILEALQVYPFVSLGYFFLGYTTQSGYWEFFLFPFFCFIYVFVWFFST